MSELLPCEVAMGLLRGREIQGFVERATGETCPCRQGKVCPLEAVIAEQDRAPELKIPRARYSALVVLVAAALVVTGGDLTALAGFPTWRVPVGILVSSLHLFS